jgi:putative aldouronate transport system substrate-binding protein
MIMTWISISFALLVNHLHNYKGAKCEICKEERFMLIRNKKLLGVLLIAVGIMTGCSKEVETPKDPRQGSTNNSSINAPYPVKTDKILKVWMQLNSNLAFTVKNFGEAPLAKELEKKTGVKVEYIHPIVGQEKEQFNLLLASRDMPDIIEYNWYAFPGGPEKAISDGYILRLNDVIDKYAPDLKEYLQHNKEADKQVKTDTGSYYVFPFIRGDENLLVSGGPIIRKDWLDEVGLNVPSTIDEWYTALKAFKEKKNATAPLSFRLTYLNWGSFSGAYGVTKGIYVEGGKVKFGQMEPGYKDYMVTFRRWYAEGLLDKNIASVDNKILDSNITDNKTGASTAYAGSGLGKWQAAMADKNPKVKFIGTTYPTLKSGQTPKFGQRDFTYSTDWSAAITASSKNADLAARWLNFGYSAEGKLVYNFGIEGESYKMEDGYPKYTDLIMKNPDKLLVTYAMARYVRGSYGGPIIQDPRYIEQYMELSEQKEAVNNWMKTDV